MRTNVFRQDEQDQQDKIQTQATSQRSAFEDRGYRDEFPFANFRTYCELTYFREVYELIPVKRVCVECLRKRRLYEENSAV